MPRKKPNYSPLPGFPIEIKFQCMEEIEKYFSGNSIQCRECGHHFRALPRHLAHHHEISADEYRERHGLPWLRGLTSGHLHVRLSQQAKEDGAVSHIGGPRPAKGRKLTVRNYCPARVNARRVYPREVYFLIADRVSAGEALLTICNEDGAPHISSVFHFMSKDGEFASYWGRKAAPAMLRWQTAVRQNLTSGRVSKAIMMAASGHSAKDIAKETGYSEANARMFLRGGNWGEVRKSIILADSISELNGGEQ